MVLEAIMARVAQAGKYLTFIMDGQEYGLEILKVHEIVDLGEVRPWPDSPRCLQGVLELRNRTLPIIDIRSKLRIPPAGKSDKTCIVVVQMQYERSPLMVGLVVDEVAEVLTVTEDEIEFPPSGAGGLEAVDFIAGVGKLDDKTVILLDADSVLDEAELQAVAGFHAGN